jgi:hypothetical protein
MIYLYCSPLLLLMRVDFILSLIFMYGSCKYIQTYRDKVIVSRRITNQHVRVTGAWEEEWHYRIIFRWVSLPLPHLNIAIAWHLKSSWMLNHPSECVATLMSSDIVHPLFLNLSMRVQDFRSVEQDLSLAFCFS